MIKYYKDLTASDKERFVAKIKREIESVQDTSWPEMERKMQAFLDTAFDDALFMKMSPEDMIDASYCRKEFKEKPSLEDFLIWQGRFVANTEYVDVPD